MEECPRSVARVRVRRYASGDHVERWLHDVLCLDAGEAVAPPPPRLPHPDECTLYLVERDTLFSYHKVHQLLSKCTAGMWHDQLSRQRTAPRLPDSAPA